IVLSTKTSHLVLVVLTSVILSHVLLPTPRSTLFPYTTLFRSQLEEMANGNYTLGDLVMLLDNAEHVAGEAGAADAGVADAGVIRSEEHTSELQSRFDLVCRLLLEKKK